MLRAYEKYRPVPWRELIADFPEDIRQAIIDNAHPAHDKTRITSLAEVISVVVRQWNHTPQGWLWWRELHNKYANREHKMYGIYHSDGWSGWSHGLSDVW